MESTTNTSGAGMCSCGCKCHSVLPALIVIFGLVFLLGNLNILTWAAVSVIWPILVILGGFAKMFKGKCGCCKK